jgi:hypothetical protein
MNFQDAVRANLAISDFFVQSYLGDLTPEEMLRRPAPDANHIAWQVGHLIQAEWRLVEAGVPGSMPPLPAGLAEPYTSERARSDNPADYLTKEEYLAAAKDVRAATLRVLQSLSETDFDKPVSGRVPPFVKRIGDCFVTIGAHWASHAGQWVVTRRMLGRDRIF